jgi:hypothetical protein
MISDGLARYRRGLILGSALALGVGIAGWQNSALAGVSEQGHAKDVRSLTSDAWASGAIVVAEKDGDDNEDDNDKKHRKGKNANRNEDDGYRHGEGGGDNGHRNGGNNGNWNNDGSGGKYGHKGDHDGNGNNGHWKGEGNWSNGKSNKYGEKGDHNGGSWDKNGYQRWSQNHKNYGKGWSGYNNNWNRNWDRRAYVRNWNRQPYYGEFIGGVVLGSLLAANGIGVVPYAPEPYLCWYWADPYMIRGYWDYCY